MANTKVPVTVVTGFLGAGKTTLVNHILQGKHGKRIAVIENEFGEVSVDDALVMESKEEIFEMSNGCICCTVRGDLIRILHKLGKRKSKFDAVLIETTGLANPSPVIQTFYVDDDIKEQYVLDAVLTVVDAKHVMQHLDEQKTDGVVNEAVQQVAFADKLLLSKLDLVDEQEKHTVVKRIKAINAYAEILECHHGEAPLERILGIDAFSLDRLLAKDPHLLEDDDHHSHGSHSSHSHSHSSHSHHSDNEDDGDSHAEPQKRHKQSGSHHHDHKHDDSVTSVGITAPGACNFELLNAWLSKLLRERGADLFRSKGVLSIQGSPDKHVFQGVHMLLQFSSSAEGSGRPWGVDEPRLNRLVFIGRNLDREELTSSFNSCIVAS